MILPSSTLASLLLLILTLICWGTWANSQRLVFKWRFELFYYDFALGAAACVILAAFTFGSLNSQELTMNDNMTLAPYRKIAWGLVAGVVFNLANMLLVAAISVAGLTVSFPISFGIAMIVTATATYVGNPQSSNALLLFGGVLLVLISVVTDAFAYKSHLDALAALSKAGPILDPRTRQPAKSKTAPKGILLGVLSGIAYGFFFPLLDSSRTGDNGVGPYGLAALVGAGLLFSTLLYVPFFINFPVQGEPVQVRDYFKGAKKQHFWGAFAGVVWAIGLIAALLEYAAPPAARTGPALTSMLIGGAPILAALCGLFAWSEFKGAPQGVRMMLVGTVVLFLAGLGLMSLAPVYAVK
jgi:glucose uptake protein